MPKKKKPEEQALVPKAFSWLWGKTKDGAGWVKDNWVQKVWRPHLKQSWKDNIAKPFKDNVSKPFKQNVWKPLKKGAGPTLKSLSNWRKEFGKKVSNHEDQLWKSNFLLGLSVFFAAIAGVGGLYTSFLVAQAIASEYFAGIFIYGMSMIGGAGMFSILAYKSFEASSEGYMDYWQAWEDQKIQARAKEKEKNKGKGKEKDGKEGKAEDMKLIGSDEPRNVGTAKRSGLTIGAHEGETSEEEQDRLEKLAEMMPSLLPEGQRHVRRRVREKDEEHEEGEVRGRGAGDSTRGRKKEKKQDKGTISGSDE